MSVDLEIQTLLDVKRMMSSGGLSDLRQKHLNANLRKLGLADKSMTHVMRTLRQRIAAKESK